MIGGKADGARSSFWNEPPARGRNEKGELQKKKDADRKTMRYGLVPTGGGAAFPFRKNENPKRQCEESEASQEENGLRTFRRNDRWGDVEEAVFS